MKTKTPKIPDVNDYKKAFKAMCVLRDFYKHDYHNDTHVKPSSFFGKKVKVMESAIRLLPASIRNA
jgi:hypothetical protein